jgi:hypothetical protein
MWCQKNIRSWLTMLATDWSIANMAMPSQLAKTVQSIVTLRSRDKGFEKSCVGVAKE